jgi:hypothetical protein
MVSVWLSRICKRLGKRSADLRSLPFSHTVGLVSPFPSRPHSALTFGSRWRPVLSSWLHQEYSHGCADCKSFCWGEVGSGAPVVSKVQVSGCTGMCMLCAANLGKLFRNGQKDRVQGVHLYEERERECMQYKPPFSWHAKPPCKQRSPCVLRRYQTRPICKQKFHVSSIGTRGTWTRLGLGSWTDQAALNIRSLPTLARA